MPDEPTMEQMKDLLIWASLGVKRGGFIQAQSETFQAIRRRIERKVSREWVEKWAAVFNDKYQYGTFKMEWEPKSVIRNMLKELGEEVEE